MNNIKKYLKNNIFSLRFIPKIISIMGGMLVGYVLASGVGIAIGAIIGFFFEELLAKAINNKCFKSI
jgi:hypothetical protein